MVVLESPQHLLVSPLLGVFLALAIYYLTGSSAARLDLAFALAPLGARNPRAKPINGSPAFWQLEESHDVPPKKQTESVVQSIGRP